MMEKDRKELAEEGKLKMASTDDNTAAIFIELEREKQPLTYIGQLRFGQPQFMTRNQEPSRFFSRVILYERIFWSRLIRRRNLLVPLLCF